METSGGYITRKKRKGIVGRDTGRQQLRRPGGGVSFHGENVGFIARDGLEIHRRRSVAGEDTGKADKTGRVLKTIGFQTEGIPNKEENTTKGRKERMEVEGTGATRRIRMCSPSRLYREKFRKKKSCSPLRGGECKTNFKGGGSS